MGHLPIMNSNSSQQEGIKASIIEAEPVAEMKEIRIKKERMGNKIGMEFVDFMDEFGRKNSLNLLIGQICSHLEGKDLTVMSCVSTTWRGIIKEDKLINKRRKEYLASVRELKKEVGTENWPIKKGKLEDRPANRGAFGDIQNYQTPLTTNRRRLHVSSIGKGDCKSSEKSPSQGWLSIIKEWGLKKSPFRKCKSEQVSQKTTDLQLATPVSEALVPTTEVKAKTCEPKTEKKNRNSERKLRRDGAMAGSRESKKHLRRL